MITSSTVNIGQEQFPVKFEDCEDQGGHCFRSTDITLTSNPPQYPEYCRHCGATRVGMQQPPMSYGEIVPRS